MASILCRVCLESISNHTVTYNIFSEQSWDPSYAYKITAITKIQISDNDHLPECICWVCAKRIDDSFNLKQQIERSDEYFKSMDLEVKNIKPEDTQIETVVKDENNPDNYIDEYSINSKEDNSTNARIEHTDNCEQFPASQLQTYEQREQNLNIYLRTEEETQIGNQVDVQLESEHYEIRGVTEGFVPNENVNIPLEKSVGLPITCINEQEDISGDQQKTISNTINSKYLRETHCTICGETGRTKGWLNYHMRSHKSKGLFKCQYCAKSFVNKAILKRHMRFHSGPIKSFQCDVCYHNYNSLISLTKHKREIHKSNEPGEFACTICGRDFKHQGVLAYHMSAFHLPDKFKDLVCNVCGLAFVQKALLTEHKRSIHNIQNQLQETSSSRECNEDGSSQSILDNDNRETMINNNSPISIVEFEEQKFPTEEVEVNQETERGDKLKESNQELELSTNSDKSQSVLIGNTENPLFTEIMIMGPQILKLYQCNVCGKTLKAGSWLRYHYRMHNTEGNHKCRICGKAFHLKSILTKHIKTHTGEKVGECYVCFKKFTQMGHLKHHIRSVHEGATPYKCHYCQKSFKSNSSLKSHVIQQHEVGRNIFCPKCNKAFNRKDTLQKHMRTHDTVSCDICGLVFSQAFGKRGAVEHHKKVVHNVQV